MKFAAARWKLYRNPRVGMLKRLGQNIMKSTDGVYGRFTPEQVLNANIYDQVSRGVVANARTAVSPRDIQKVLRGIDRISGSASESLASDTRKDLLDAYRSIRSRPAGVDFSGKSVEDFKDALSKRNLEIRDITHKLNSIRGKFSAYSDAQDILSRLMLANSDGHLYRGASTIVNYPNAGIKNLRRNGISSAFGMESLIGGYYRGVAPNSDRALYAKANGRDIRDYAARNPLVGKESSLLNKYGLTYEDLVSLLRKNGATDAVFKGTRRDTSLQDIIDTARNSRYGESWWSHNPAVSIGYAKDGGLVVLYPGKQGNLRKEIYKRFTNHQATPDRSVQRDVNKRITDGHSVSRRSGSSAMGDMFDYEVTLNADELERARQNSMRFNIYGSPHGRLPEMHGLQKDTTGWLYPLRFMPGSLSDVDPYLTVTNIKNPSQLAFRDPTVRTLSDIGLRRYTQFTK